MFQYLSRYLAPEFFTDGKVTEKVDIYAFGLVLLELITGKKTSDFLYYKGQSLLLENSYPSAKMEPIHILAHKHQLLDSNLASTQLQNLPRELQAMGFAASLCLQREPDMRPPMSKVFPLSLFQNENTSSTYPLVVKPVSFTALEIYIIIQSDHSSIIFLG